MRWLLLDTQILITLIDQRSDRLSERIEAALAAPEARLFVSVASLWEIAIKTRLGKLRLNIAIHLLPELIDAMQVDLLPILASHVLANAEPEPPTRDPFDRLLLAQCAVEGFRLVTIDRALVAHPLAFAPD
jgi:PIN domain nuclease of toxin-antitoxin system